MNINNDNRKYNTKYKYNINCKLGYNSIFERQFEIVEESNFYKNF